LQTGLTAFYPFCGNANNATGLGSNGTVDGAALTVGPTGTAATAYEFFGTLTSGSRITMDYSVAMSPLNSGINTVAFWITNPGIDWYNHILYQFRGYSLSFFPAPNNRLVSLFQATTEFVSSATAIPNAWTHVAFVRDGDRHRVFVNGVLEAEAVNTAIPSSTALIWIGAADGGYWIKGKLSKFMVYNRALLATEVSQLAQR
jgi:hypothetical protein